MRKLTLPLLALFALALPASAAWTYVADAGAWNGQNDKKYSGYVTDGATWSIFVLDLGDGNWQLGAGTWGVDGGNGGSCQAGTTKTSTGIGSGALDVRDITTDTGMTFSKIGPRCFYKHSAITAITIPDTVTEIGNAAFVQCANLVTITLENGCPNLVTLGSGTGIFEGSQKISELDLGNTKITTLYRNFDSSTGFHRLVFPETLVTMKNWATAYITDNDMVFHFKGAMPTTIESNAIRPRNISSSRKWAFKVDVNTKGTWPIRTDVPFADATLPSVSGETFAEADYLGYLYLSDLGDNGNGEGMKIWVFKEGVPAAVVPASMAVTATSGRTNATLTATVDLGTSASATVTATLNGETQTATASQNGAVSFEFYGLTLDTAYAWTATVQGADDAAVSGTSHGTVSTLPPEVTLGATSFTQPKDGLSATVSVVVATLTSASADIEFTFDGAVMETRTVTAAGTYDFAVSGLTVGSSYPYSFRAVSSENADEAEVSGTLAADRYHWVYTPGAGYANGCPYTGTVSDRNWRIRVWQCDPENHPDEFWLGVGSYGTVGVEAGEGVMDLSTLYADTLAAGTPVKIVRVGGYFWYGIPSSEFTGLVLPDTVREIGFYAFYGDRGLGSVDLSNTQITNIAARAFQDNYGCTNFFLPKTLQKVGGCAFAWGHSKRVFHFRGDMPEVTLTTSDIGTGTVGGDQSFYVGNGNQQQVYCVDSVRFPRWRTDTSTTLYEDGQGNSTFPSGEQSWIPAHVRYGTSHGYKKPFGNSTLGRAFDTSSNGRAYLVFEPAAESATLIVVK